MMRREVGVILVVLAAAAAGTGIAQQETPRPGNRSETPASPTEDNARAALEKAGYSRVRDLKASPKGVTAKATRDGRDVSVVVDPSGRVEELQQGQ